MSDSDFSLRLTVFRRGSLPVSLGDYLAGDPDWVPALSHCAIVVRSAGREWLDSSYNMGSMDRLAAQFEAAIPRLERGQLALVRSAVEDEAWVPSILIEPRGAELAMLSLIYLAETEMAYVYPLPPGASETEALYAFLARNCEQLVVPPADVDAASYLTRRAFPLAGLTAALGREAALARRLYARLGEPFNPRDVPGFPAP